VPVVRCIWRDIGNRRVAPAARDVKCVCSTGLECAMVRNRQRERNRMVNCACRAVPLAQDRRVVPAARNVKCTCGTGL
jgi:hypothetical protein